MKIKKIIELIGKTSEPTRSELYEEAYRKIEKALSQDNDEIMHVALHAGRLLPTPLVTKLVMKGLVDPSLRLQSLASGLISFAEEEKRTEFVQKGLEQPEVAVQINAVNAIRDVPLAERKALLMRATRDDMPNEVKDASVLAIQWLEEQDRLFFIEQLLKGETRTLRLNGIYAIEFAPIHERARLIQMMLQDADERVRSSAVSVIYKASPDEHKRLLDFAIAHTSGPARITAERYLIHYEQGDFGKDLLIDSVVRDTPLPPEDSEFFTYLQEEVAEDTSLYDHHPKRFGRKAFSKTGSGTTLLDVVPGKPAESLRGKAVIRHIELTAYASWKQAYEADALWKKRGFSYVPIEPIVGARFSDNEEAPWDVDVFTRVLGINAFDWFEETNGIYEKHITEQMDTIRDTLKEMNIVHGHLHQRNFCLVFEKNKEGKPDITKPPRVYAIDFDQASSPPPK